MILRVGDVVVQTRNSSLWFMAEPLSHTELLGECIANHDVWKIGDNSHFSTDTEALFMAGVRFVQHVGDRDTALAAAQLGAFDAYF